MGRLHTSRLHLGRLHLCGLQPSRVNLGKIHPGSLHLGKLHLCRLHPSMLHLGGLYLGGYPRDYLYSGRIQLSRVHLARPHLGGLQLCSLDQHADVKCEMNVHMFEEIGTIIFDEELWTRSSLKRLIYFGQNNNRKINPQLTSGQCYKTFSL
jgi:hypothetical protein